jgi:hypothetical protein
MPGFFVSEVSGAAMPLCRLFPSRLAQGFVDAVLPAGPALLEVFEHVLVDPQRDQFLDATLVVVRLNAASASVRASFRVRGRLG